MIKRAIEEIHKSYKSQTSGAILLSGEAFSGKSSVLLKLASELIDSGYKAWQFVGDEALDVEAALHWTMRDPKAVLLVDNSSDFAKDVHELLEEAKSRRIVVQVVLVDRARRSKHISEILATERFAELKVHGKLSAEEVDALIVTLDAKRRLGALTNESKTSRKKYFNDHGEKIFSAMAALEDGRGFQQRVSDELARASSKSARALLAAVSLTSRLGYPLPFELTKTSCGLTAADAQILVDGELSDLLEVRSGGIATRHRIFGELLIDELSGEVRKEAVVRLALAAAPNVSPAAIRASTIYYRIARGLMGAEILGELFRSHSETILEVYADLEDAYDWNARYWDQRALAAADAHRYEKAYSWAEQAVARKRDALSLTTTGKVLMLRAVSEASAGEWPTDTFEKAERYLADAKQVEGNRAEYPIETFLYYVARLVRMVPDRDPALNRQIRTLWNSWFASIAGLEEGSKLRLDRIRRESLRDWEAAGFDGA